MPESSPKYGLTRNGRGWVKRIGRGEAPRWIVSANVCPTGEAADAFFEANFPELTKQRQKPIGGVIVFREAAELFVRDREARKLHRGTLRDYEDTMRRFGRAVGGDRPTGELNDADARKVEPGLMKLGTARRLKHAVNIRAFIRWCGKRGIPCGWTVETFTAPPKAERRRDRAARQKTPFTTAQVRRLMRHASDRMRLAILLGLNAAMGPEELLGLTYADVKAGILAKPRQKTGIKRRAVLWPETRAAINVAGGHGLLFADEDGRVMKPTTLMRKFRALCDRACVPPMGHYTLRRTFRTIADDLGDQRAAALVMGRELPDVDTVYVLAVKDERIARVLEHVRTVLQIGSAWAARRRTQGQRGLAARLERRGVPQSPESPRLRQPTPAAPDASNATSRRSGGKGPSRRR